MRTFMLLSFVFLGVGFYELSGGSDFEPVERQVFDVSFADEGNGVQLQAVSAPALRVIEPVVTTAALNAQRTTNANDAVIVQISSKNIDPAPVPAPQVQPTPQIELATVSGNAVNMRLGPSTQYGVVSTLGRGTEVEVLETASNGWARLRVVENGQVGWMSGRFVAQAGT
ncbi:hypothetical protein BVC71_06205 [Marivivens niveibacter]|uniref:SH3b domain-containing protein n=1 Tax=Marivivens niveibacter TaxID=1930667 RepID=A0A251WZT2_9RHOB|nr:SH3 domain-containing protein [Marivivens niveibacter]OUD09443.1 hypothetical protein BVC71_06205 [Marivivens niveibacter]